MANILSTDYVKSLSFEQLKVHLQDAGTIRFARTCLDRIAGPCNVKVFLASYLIANHPESVFETKDEALFDSAILVVSEFEKICLIDERNGEFEEIIRRHEECFRAWKVKQEDILAKRINHALVGLYESLQYEHAGSRLSVEIRTQIDRLRAKLAQVGGPNAIERLDERIRNMPDVKPVHIEPPMTNEQLAHELLFDPSFQIGKPAKTPLHNAFWTSVTDDLRLETPIYARILRVLEEVRDGFRELHGNAVDTVIDIERIKNQARETGLIQDWDSCKAFVDGVVALVRRVQAPRREGETEELYSVIKEQMASSDDRPLVFCSALEFMLDRVNAMRLDLANARLRLISGVVLTNGVGYERLKFEEKLTNGTITTAKTEAWIAETFKGGDLIAMHQAGMIALVVGTTPIRQEILPETLFLDAHRLMVLQSDFNRIVDGCSVLTVLSQTIVGEAFVELSKRIVALDDCSFINVSAALTGAGLLTLANRTAIRISLDKTSPVRVLMATRVGMLYANEGTATVIHGFLPAIEAQRAKLTALAAFNCAIHYETYERLLSRE